MRKDRIGFFTRLLLAFGDFRIYPFSQKESLVTAVVYLLKLVAICSVIIGCCVLVKIYNYSCEMFEEFKNTSSDFVISNGVLIANDKSSGELIENVYYLIDGNKSSGDIKASIDIFPTTAYGMVLLFQDNAYVVHRFPDDSIQTVKLGYEEFDISNRTELIKSWDEWNESYTARLVLLIALIFFIFILFVIIRFWTFLIYLCVAYMVNSFFGANLKFKGYIKVAIYTSTIPIILDTISIAVLGNVPQLASFIEGIICFVYAFCGIRAIKIDELFMSGIGKTPEERITDAIMKAQKEIEEKLKEVEKDKKEKQEKNEEEKKEEDKK